MVETVTLAKQREKTRVGAWYALWYDALEEGSFWDNEGTGQVIRYKPLLPDGTYGRHDSGDDAVIQFHIEEIAKAGIDFLIFDQTNDIDARNITGQTWINDNSLKTAKAIWAWNQVPGNRRLEYCSSVGTFASVDKATMLPVVDKMFWVIEEEAQKLYERYMMEPWGESHVLVDGKPLMVVFTLTQAEWEGYAKDHETPWTDKFALRFAIGHAYDPGYWGWVIPFGATVTEDVCCIIPGWFKLNHPFEKVYRDRGRAYQENWERLLRDETIPDFVVINSINEFAEHTGVFPAVTSDFPDDYPIERWLNPEGEEDPTMYWAMTKKYIGKYRRGDRV